MQEVGPNLRFYLKGINFTDAGIIGKIFVVQDGKSMSVPKGTKVILQRSSNPDAPLQSFTTANERGEFILPEPIITLHFHGDTNIARIFPQSHIFKIVLSAGEEYLHVLDITEEDADSVKVFYRGSRSCHRVRGYASLQDRD